MPTIIQIDYQLDRAQTIDVLSDAGETYSRTPGNRFIVSDRAPSLLRARGIRFVSLGDNSDERRENGR